MKIEWGKVFTSKAIWLGFFMVVTAIVEYIAGLPPETTIIQAVSGVLAIIIRFLTNDSLTTKQTSTDITETETPKNKK